MNVRVKVIEGGVMKQAICKAMRWFEHVARMKNVKLMSIKLPSIYS